MRAPTAAAVLAFAARCGAGNGTAARAAGTCDADSPANACGPCSVESDCGHYQSGSPYYCQKIPDPKCKAPKPPPPKPPSPTPPGPPPPKPPSFGCCTTKGVLPCGSGIMGKPTEVDYDGVKYCCPKGASKTNPCPNPGPPPPPPPPPSPKPPSFGCCTTKGVLPCGSGILGKPTEVDYDGVKYCCPKGASKADPCPGPTPPTPPSPPLPSDCHKCVKQGYGASCLPECAPCGSACTSCIKGAGGKACADRCCASPVPPPPPSPTPPSPPPPSGCSSMRAVSAAQLQCVYPQLGGSKASTYASKLSSKLGGAITNRCAWAAFLANVGTESSGLTQWTQIPCNSATAAPYCGRGPLQITGETNYAYCAKQGICDCSGIVGSPTEASDDVNVGIGTAACVWDSLSGHDLSRNADGTLSGLRATACYINAGHSPCSVLNGWESRQAYWKAANSCL